jgi:hypothetical protein
MESVGVCARHSPLKSFVGLSQGLAGLRHKPDRAFSASFLEAYVSKLADAGPQVRA